jgi:hypothetical protein
MNKKIPISILSLFIIFLSVGFVYGIDFHGRLSNSIYSFEDTKTRTQVYQFVNFSANAPEFANATLNASLRALTDLSQSLDSDQRFKAYNLNLKFSKLFNRVDLTLGRQFLHPGTVLGGLDGLYAKFYITKKMNLAAYGGVESNFQRSFEIYKFKDSFTTGGLFELNRALGTNFQLFYLQKANEDDIYWQLAGLNINNSLLKNTNFRLQAHYDLQNERFHRLFFFASHSLLDNKLAFSLNYKQQHPQVYANSYYTIFEVDPYNQYQLEFSYNFMKNYFANAQYRIIRFDDDETANQFFATVSNNSGSIGLLYESGYAGDQLSLIFDYAYSITPQLLASLNIDYSRYRTETIYEFENQIANAVRLSYKFQQHWTVDLEFQWLSNRFKEQDSRILNHINFQF